jgi:hypothetical protein
MSTSQEPPAGFHDAFDSTIIEKHLLPALRRGYATACEQYDDERGNTSRTFGYNLYYVAGFEIASESEKSNGRLIVESTDPRYEFKVGPFNLACHRVGRNAEDSIWVSFPHNYGPSAGLYYQQLTLPLNIELTDNVVLAHMGNPKQGLTAVYLCIPQRVSRGTIKQWGYAQQVWVAESTGEVVPTEPEIILKPVVLIKKRSSEGPA